MGLLLIIIVSPTRGVIYSIALGYDGIFIIIDSGKTLDGGENAGAEYDMICLKNIVASCLRDT